MSGAVARPESMSIVAGVPVFPVSCIVFSCSNGVVFMPIAKRIPGLLATILMVASVRTADWKSLKLMPRARWSYESDYDSNHNTTVVKDSTIAVVVGVLSAIVIVGAIAFHRSERRRWAESRHFTLSSS